MRNHGDLPGARFRPDPGRHPQNLDRVVAVAGAVAEVVESVLRDGETPLVLGGDCTIELGVLSGFLRAGEDPALLYLDGGVDLFTPATNPTGILDSMGVAHMVAAEALSRIGPRFPLMDDETKVMFGYEPNPPEMETFARRSMHRLPAKEVRSGAEDAAADALSRLELLARSFVVHFDVDVIDFVDFPVADVPQHNAGLTFREVTTSLGVFASSPRLAGLVVTELNPDHADEEGELAARFVQEIAAALAGKMA